MNEREKRTELLEYLPEYLQGYHEMREIMGTESRELWEIEDCHERCMDESFMMTCGEYGMRRFERMLGISPLADDSLDARRFRIMSRWNAMDAYNYAFMERQLKMLCGENGYSLNLDFARQEIKVKVALTSKNMLDSVKDMLDAILPCNLLRDVGLMYNQYMRLKKLTYGQMERRTYKQLREDVILG